MMVVGKGKDSRKLIAVVIVSTITADIISSINAVAALDVVIASITITMIASSINASTNAAV